MSKKKELVWLRCQETIRKLLLVTGRDALAYAQLSLEKEASEPEKLATFWKNARRIFEEYEAAS